MMGLKRWCFSSQLRLIENDYCYMSISKILELKINVTVDYIAAKTRFFSRSYVQLPSIKEVNPKQDALAAAFCIFFHSTNMPCLAREQKVQIKSW